MICTPTESVANVVTVDVVVTPLRDAVPIGDVVLSRPAPIPAPAPPFGLIVELETGLDVPVVALPAAIPAPLTTLVDAILDGVVPELKPWVLVVDKAGVVVDGEESELDVTEAAKEALAGLVVMLSIPAEAVEVGTSDPVVLVEVKIELSNAKSVVESVDDTSCTSDVDIEVEVAVVETSVKEVALDVEISVVIEDVGLDVVELTTTAKAAG